MEPCGPLVRRVNRSDDPRVAEMSAVWGALFGEEVDALGAVVNDLVPKPGRYRLVVSRYHSGQFFNQTASLKTEDTLTKDLS